MNQAKLQVVGSNLDPTQPEWYKQPRRPIAEILAGLSKPILSKYLDTRKQGYKNTLTYWTAFKLNQSARYR